jgi:hypothetical protein
MKEVIDKIEELFNIKLSDSDLDLIKRLRYLPDQNLSDSKGILLDNLSIVIKTKSELNLFVYRLRDLFNSERFKFNLEYNRLFVILTKSGRPSKHAIDCEIFHNNPELDKFNKRLNDIEILVEFFNTCHTILDLLIKNIESKNYSL